MIDDCLVSGLSAVDSGLQLYWEVRRMVYEGKEKEETTLADAKKESCTSNSQDYGRNCNFKKHDSAKPSNYLKRQSLPTKLSDDEMGSMGWSRPQDNAYRSIGCKSVVKISSSTHFLCHTER